MNISNIRFLILDTSHPSNKLISFLLKKERTITSTAFNYQSFLHYLKHSMFDAIILIGRADLLKTDHYVKKARQFPEYHHTPIFVFSPGADSDTVVHFFKEGADDIYFNTPNRKLIHEKLKSLIRRIETKKVPELRDPELHTNKLLHQIIILGEKNTPHLFPIKRLHQDVKLIHCPTSLFFWLELHSATALLININCDWAIHQMVIIKSMCLKREILLIFLFPDTPLSHHQQKIIRQYADGIIHTGISDTFTIFQINAHLNREIAIRKKYLNALSEAANKSPMHSAEEYEENTNNIRFSILHKSYEQTPGGDFYEVFEPNDQYRIIIYGDVMGKKWGAWLFVQAFTGYVHSTIKALTSWFLPQFLKHPSEALSIINHFIYKDFQWSDVFTTMSIIVLDLYNSTLKVSSAGNLYPIYSNNLLNKLTFLKIGGPLLGVVKNPTYSESNISLNHGDKLICYTDGYSEATNSKTGELIGDDPLLKLMKLCKSKDYISPAFFEKRLQKEHHIVRFNDDRTLIIISKSNLHFLPPHHPRRRKS
ncbi:MAG: fused response regulator/phosphatase [Marinilabiliaceae bacterium]|nr:fused response regulator/phosphatase [Marinilabiliaceae bacterium]